MYSTIEAENGDNKCDNKCTITGDKCTIKERKGNFFPNIPIFYSFKNDEVGKTNLVLNLEKPFTKITNIELLII